MGDLPALESSRQGFLKTPAGAPCGPSGDTDLGSWPDGMGNGEAGGAWGTNRLGEEDSQAFGGLSYCGN